MSIEHELSPLDAAAASLREYGFRVDVTRGGDHRHDALMRLEKSGVTRTFAVDVKIPLTAASAAAGGDDDRIYVTDHVSPRTAAALRRLGVRFIDAAGNASIDADTWQIDIRGRARSRSGTARGRGENATNLFSARRAQVIFALVTWPGLMHASIRTVAEAAGVSVGIAQSVTNELERRSLWPGERSARERLIDAWAAAFPETLARSLTIRAVRADKLDLFFGDVLTSGEIAPSVQMRPSSGVVYVPELTTELLMQNRWRTDGVPNVIVRRRFWSMPGEPPSGEAPALLVYGDLLASPDPRTRSVALEYRRRLTAT